MAVQKSMEIGSIAGLRDPKKILSQALQLAPASSIDFDAAIRIFRAFIRDMTGSSGFHQDKLLRKPININDVLKAIRSFPENRLNDNTPTGITVRELLGRVSHFSRIDEVKKAVKEKLQIH